MIVKFMEKQDKDFVMRAKVQNNFAPNILSFGENS